MSVDTLVDNRFQSSDVTVDAFDIQLEPTASRVCAMPECGAKLRTGNVGTICATCERKMELRLVTRKPPASVTTEVPVSELRMDLYWRGLTPGEKYLLLEYARAAVRMEESRVA